MWSNVSRSLASAIFAVYGLFCVSSGIACLINVNALLKVAQTSEATVVQGDSGKQLVWRAPDGTGYSFAPGVLFPDYTIGETVAILYHPENHAYWKINSFTGLRLWGLLMDVAGISLLALAVALLPKGMLAAKHRPSVRGLT